jgi:hypothetical protein
MLDMWLIRLQSVRLRERRVYLRYISAVVHCGKIYDDK